VTSPADLTHAVLLRVAEFIRGLPADQLAALADGTAKLEIAGRGRARTTTATRAKTPAAPPVQADRVREELAAIGDRAAAGRYLEDLKLTVAQLRALAKELGIAVPSKATKAAVLHEIVQWTVGRRLDSEAISRPTPAIKRLG
jgi:hypothetical protein